MKQSKALKALSNLYLAAIKMNAHPEFIKGIANSIAAVEASNGK